MVGTQARHWSMAINRLQVWTEDCVRYDFWTLCRAGVHYANSETPKSHKISTKFQPSFNQVSHLM